MHKGRGGGGAGSLAEAQQQRGMGGSSTQPGRRHPGAHFMLGEGHWLPALHCAHVDEPKPDAKVPGRLRKSQGWQVA